VRVRDVLRALRVAWPLVVVLTLVGAGVGAIVASVQRPVYVATAKAYVAVASATSTGDLIDSAQYTQQIAASFADIAGTSYVLQPVIARLGLRRTAAELAASVSVTASPGEAVLEVEARDSSPAEAARIANAIGGRLSTAVASLTPAGGRVAVTLVDPATPPGAPVSPVPLLDVAVGGGAGLVLGALLIALRALSDTRVRTAEDVRALTAAPILASTPEDDAVRRRPAVFDDDPQGPLAESFRALRVALQFLDVDDGARSVVVTSSVETEGKSVTALNLAVALAETGERVLLVDADLRRPAVADLLGLEGAVGLTDVLIDRTPLDQAVQSGEHGLLAVLPSGAVPPNPNELLQSHALERLIPVLERRYDRVVIDAPPVLAVSDAAILAHRASGALLVVRSGRVQRAQLQGALDALRRAKAPVLGIVLTMVPLRETDAGAALDATRRRRGPDRTARSVRPPFVPPEQGQVPRTEPEESEPVDEQEPAAQQSPVDRPEEERTDPQEGPDRAADEP
jgi:succinoglycan biosynthesis transport protein ExoP